MTLCLGWFGESNIYLASDSRITFGSLPTQVADIGIKVFCIPISIINPISEETVKQNIGLCFAGSTTNVLIFKETILSILNQATLNPLGDELSMDTIIEIIRRIHEKISRQICQFWDEIGEIEVLVAGYCMKTNSRRLFRIWTSSTSDPITSQFSEILQNTQYIAIGSGATEANKYLSKIHPHFNSKWAFKAIDYITKSKIIPSVGGPIQVGRFNGNNFCIYGIQNTNTDQFGFSLPTNYFGYFTTDEISELLADIDIISTPSFLLPFR